MTTTPDKDNSMKTYTQEELDEIIRKHSKWLKAKEGGERADLSGAYLSGAYLSGAYLSGAYLSGAYLRELASIWSASGNRAEIKAIQADTWDVTYTATHMQIGCQLHKLEEWWAFSDGEIGRMDSKALEWWKVWKPILQTIVSTSPATPGGDQPDPDQSAESEAA